MAAVGTGTDKEAYRALQAVADDFKELRDVSAQARRAAELGRDKNVRAALDKERDEDAREEMLLREVTSLAARLSSEERQAVLRHLRQRWKELSSQATNPTDSTARQLARRVLAALSADGTTDADYAGIIAEYRLSRSPQ